MKFLSDNFLYIAMMFVSGGMLLWPVLQRSRQGASVNPNGAIALMNQEDALLLDVRGADEFARGRVAQAKNVPFAELANRATELGKEPCIVVMDAAGKEASKAAAVLRAAGAARVVVLDGGYAMWIAAGLPVKK